MLCKTNDFYEVSKRYACFKRKNTIFVFGQKIVKMYEYIKGLIAELSPAHAVVETSGGVAYYLNISLQTYSAVRDTKEAKLYTYFIVREDAQILYGFSDTAERGLFKLLIGVSGVGGSTARMVLSSFTPDELRTIIATGQADVLKTVKGLGIKTAQKIIVELKDKVGDFGREDASLSAIMSAGGSPLFDESLAAMTMLGFSKQASEKVLRKVMKDNPAASVEDIIRISLKHM